MKKKLNYFLTITIVVVVFSICSSVEAKSKTNEDDSLYTEAYEKFDKAMTKKMKEEGIPSASVSVRENGKTIRTKTFGKANKDKKLPVTKKTMFSTGSVSKIYVTAAALKLVDEGKLDLNDKVTKYIPEFKMADPRYKDITVGMLLNHTSGMPGDANAIDCDWAGKVGNDDFAKNTLKELSSQELKSEPGKSSNYCNSGFVLAQQVVEKSADMGFGEYVNEKFFKPMKLKNTAMSSDTSISQDRVARPVDPQGNILPKEYIGASADGLGGMTAAPEEVAKFAEQILSPKAGYLSQDSIKKFRSDQSLSTDMPKEQLTNALGWDRISPKISETQVFEKAGGTTNYVSKVLTAPDAGITVSGSITQLNLSFTEILDELMHDLLIEKGVVKRHTQLPTLPKEQEVNQTTKSSDYYYSNDSMFGNAGIKKIDIKDNLLSMSTWESGKWSNAEKFTRREDDSFGKHDKKNNEYTGYFFKDVSGVTYLMKTTITPGYSNTTAVARKINVKEENEPSKTWKSRDNSLWLRKNVNPLDYQAFANISSLQLIKELKGYVLSNGYQPLMEIDGDETMKEITDVPGAYYPDSKVTDSTFTQMGMNFVPASEAIPLKKGKTTVNFKKANTAEWFIAPKDMKIKANTNYKKVRIIARDMATGLIYDNIGKNEDFKVPKGSYVMMTSSQARSFTFNAE